MVRQGDIIEIFRNLGWEIQREPGGPSCTMDLDDRVVQIVPKLKALTDKEKLTLAPSVSTATFANAVRKISKLKMGNTPLISDFRQNDVVYSVKFTEEEVREISDRIVSWAKDQPVEAALTELQAVRTDAPGDQALKHLAALALAGHSDRLQSYRDSFLAGDRLGFVPYITVDYLDRALKISSEK